MALIHIGKTLSTYCLGIDLALLSMADVSLLTYGSFGDFGAILYKDKKEVVFPKSHPAHWNKHPEKWNKHGKSLWTAVEWEETRI